MCGSDKTEPYKMAENSSNLTRYRDETPKAKKTPFIQADR